MILTFRMLLGISHYLWHKTAVPVFIERYLLPALAALTGGLIILNPMKFDVAQRVSLGIAILAAAFFLAHTLHLYNESSKRSAQSTSVPAEAALTPSETISPEPETPLHPYYDLFMAFRRPLFDMEEKVFQYQAAGDRNPVNILCRIDLPLHDQPTLSVYIPHTASPESTMDSALYVVERQREIIEAILTEIRLDKSKALALESRRVSVKRIAAYYEDPLNRTALISRSSLTLEFHGPKDYGVRKPTENSKATSPNKESRRP